MVSKVHFYSISDEWETPQDIFNKLNNEFHFTLDAAATKLNSKCEKFYDKTTNGLIQSWKDEIVFLNPPYSRKTKNNTGQIDWIKKAYDESIHSTIVMLLPVRTDTKAFHDYIYNKSEIRFIRGRLKFNNSSNNAPFPSMIVIFKRRNTNE